MEALSTLFDPKAVAVVGATDRAGSVGRAIVENLLRTFDGEIVAVNPTRDSVLGVECVPSIGDGPPVDLAIVVVPPNAVLDAVEDAADAGVTHLVVITAGFAETGQAGFERERELIALADRHNLQIVGPNSLGVMSTPSALNATFGPSMADPGSISLLSQSGAFITAVLDWASAEGIGFRHVVSLGNKAVIDETDVVQAWGSDPGTDVIVGYLEGIENGRRFLEVVRQTTVDTPVVLVKAGRTEAGAKAASSHTGAIAGSERAYRAGLEQAGVIRVTSTGELLDAARSLAGLEEPAADGVAVVTNAGGPGVLTTDAVGDSGLSMATFDDDTIDALESRMPAEASVFNPIDVVGDADGDRFEAALDCALADPNVGSAVVVSAPTAVVGYDELAEIIVDCQARAGKPVVASLMGGSRRLAADEVFQGSAVPNYDDPSRAVRGLDSLATFARYRDRPLDEPATFDIDTERVQTVLERAADRSDNRLGIESMDLLEAIGLETPAGEIVDAPADASRVAEAIDGPVVLKIVSPDVSHKTDIGAVITDVSTAEAADVYETILARVRNYQPNADITGVQVQEQLDLEDATETILGMNRDPQFGPLCVFGLGGIFVEVLDDTAVRVAPVDERTAREMIDDLAAAPLLRGARGREPADIEAIVDAIQRLSQLVTAYPAILELDVNPLVAGPDGVSAVDLRLTVDTEEL